MQHVQLAAAALVLCGANVVALAAEREYANRPAGDASFAVASGTKMQAGKSPFGSVAFGRVPAPRLQKPAPPSVAAEDRVKGVGFAAVQAPPKRRDEARPVPEPPTFVMLMAGLGVLVVVISRRH
jgi:hypothetical protein